MPGGVVGVGGGGGVVNMGPLAATRTWPERDALRPARELCAAALGCAAHAHGPARGVPRHLIFREDLYVDAVCVGYCLHRCVCEV